MAKNKKSFNLYTMEFEGNTIVSVLSKNQKEVKFAYSFYEANQEFLDSFENILQFVRPKKETKKKHKIMIDLDTLEVAYSDIEENVSEEDLKLAIKLIKNELSEKNPEIQKRKALLLKYQGDIKTLEALEDDGMSFEDEKKDIIEKIEKIKKEINNIIE